MPFSASDNDLEAALEAGFNKLRGRILGTIESFGLDDKHERACFVPGTQITMSDGSSKAIEDVKVEDQVLTHTGNVQAVVEVMDRFHQGIIIELRVYDQSEPVRATEDHPVWTKRGTDAPAWVNAGDLDVGDFVLTPMPANGITLANDQPFARLIQYFIAEGQTYSDTVLSSDCYMSEAGMWRKIAKISIRDYGGKVFNFGVVNDNSYIANDIAVHNCKSTFKSLTYDLQAELLELLRK